MKGSISHWEQGASGFTFADDSNWVSSSPGGERKGAVRSRTLQGSYIVRISGPLEPFGWCAGFGTSFRNVSPRKGSKMRGKKDAANAVCNSVRGE